MYLNGRRDAASFDSVPGIGFDTNAASAAIVPPPGRISGTGPSLAVDPAQNNAFRAINRAWKDGATVSFVEGTPAAAARYVLDGLSESAQSALVQSLALIAERTAERGVEIRRPRIGVYEPWGGNMSAGWTRWILEQYGFEYVTLRPADFHTPLADKVDVVLMADGTRLPTGGGRSGGRGGRTVRPEYADILSAEDLAAFEAFIRRGGTLVCLNGASTFAIDQFKLPVANVVAGLRTDDFFLRGSIVQASIDSSHPLMAGMPETAAVFADGSPVFETREGFQGRVLARYADRGSPLLSGYLIGEKYLAGKAAALDVAVDAGHIVLLGFRPEWRGQTFGTFRVLFNAVLNVH
jgi:hypothetical protein